MKEITAKIRSVIYTLNLVEVKGRDNLDRQLGSIMALENVLNALEDQQAAASSAPHEGE